MKAEVQKILKLYEELEAAGETATLTFSTSGDKSIVKLQLQPPSLLTSSPSSQLLLQHQFLASVAAIVAQEQELAEISGQLPTQLPWLRQLPPRLRRLPSPPPESGRRQVTTVARMDVPTFSTLNVNGSSSPPPSRPPAPGFSTLGLRPPFNGTPTATPHHCLDCGSCLVATAHRTKRTGETAV